MNAHRWLPVALAMVVLAMPVRATGPGEAAPPFSLPTASGDSIILDRLRGRVVYVDFWASWCGPCKRSFPWMNAMQAKYGNRGLVVIGVNVDKRRADAERFLQRVPAEFTVVYDAAGATPAAYGVEGMPSSYLVDATGKVALVERGFDDERSGEVEARVAALLAKR